MLKAVLDRTASVPVAVAQEVLLQIAEFGGSHHLELLLLAVGVTVTATIDVVGGGGLSGRRRRLHRLRDDVVFLFFD